MYDNDSDDDGQRTNFNKKKLTLVFGSGELKKYTAKLYYDDDDLLRYDDASLHYDATSLYAMMIIHYDDTTLWYDNYTSLYAMMIIHYDDTSLWYDNYTSLYAMMIIHYVMMIHPYVMIIILLYML